VTRIRGVSRAGLILVFAFAAAAGPAAQQPRFARGQNIQPVFEGWMRRPDGTIAMYFGYLNRNYEQAIDIPVGAENTIDPGGDRGQPTHFLPRRQKFLFTVNVPADWDKQRRVIWTVTANGKTDRAQGWLQPEWELDEGVIQMNIGPGGAPPTNPSNAAPKLTLSASTATVAVSEALTLKATATDDGIPKPRTPRAGQPPPAAGSTGVWVRWMHYRGAGSVEFVPAVSPRVQGGPSDATTRVTFTQPGTYVLRAIASDGLLETSSDVTVTVK
jgi:hypothetical protein